MDKQQRRLRRLKRTRYRIQRTGAVRLVIHRTSCHIYAQLIKPNGAETMAAASTLDKEVKAAGGKCSNVESAKIVGEFIAKRGLAAGIKKAAVDRSGFKYHGCVKALVEAARVGGLEI